MDKDKFHRNRTRSTIRAVAIAAVAAFMLSSCVGRNGFAVADTDGNGSVSRAEFERYMLEAIFAESDADGNGQVTITEWKAANPDAKEWKFKAPDTNRNGAVTPAEAKAHFERYGTLDDLFLLIDSNGDGSISRSEAKQFKKQLKAQSGTPLQKLSNSVSSNK